MSFISGLFRPRDNVHRLIDELKKGGSPVALDPVIDELGLIGAPAVQPLCDAIRDRRSSYVERAVMGIALIRIGAPSEGPLRALLADSDEQVRSTAAVVLATIPKGIGDKWALALMAYYKESEIEIQKAT